MCVFMKKKIVIKKQPCGCLCFGAEGGTRSRGKPTPQTGKRRRVPAPCSWGFASGTCLHKAESPTEVIKKQRMLFCGAEGGTRTPMRLPSADFESAPSTIPALRQSTAIFLQYEYYHNPIFFASVLTKSIFCVFIIPSKAFP